MEAARRPAPAMDRGPITLYIRLLSRIFPDGDRLKGLEAVAR
jgi:hypothetical protein